MRAAACLAAALLAGCAPGTEVVVAVSAADLTVPEELARVRISVTNPSESDPSALVYDSGDVTLCATGVTGDCHGLPLDLTLRPGARVSDALVRVLVEGWAADGTALASQAAVFRFQPDQAQRLELAFRKACATSRCAEDDLACDATGSCVLIAPRNGERPLLGFDARRFDFGAQAAGTRVTHVFTLQNLGRETSGPVAIDLIGDPGFEIAANSCQGIPLGPPCRVTVAFEAQVLGAMSARLQASAAPGGAVEVELLSLKRAAALSAPTTLAFPRTALGGSTMATWEVTNLGELTTGVPEFTLSGPDASAFMVEPSCASPIAAGGVCTAQVRFAPTTTGLREATLTIEAAPGGTATVALSGEAGYGVHVTVSGPSGFVTSEPTGIFCGTSCDLVVLAGEAVTLQARTQNGSGAHFEGWSGACAGAFRDCTITPTGSGDVGARFAATSANLVFVSSVKYAANLGGLGPYDDRCNQLATAAGINDVAGTAFVAFLSSSMVNAKDRLGAASGFVRLDGKPFSGTVSDLFGTNRILNPLEITEQGARVTPAELVWTGTTQTGDMGGADCDSWSNAAGATPRTGTTGGGPGSWISRMALPGETCGGARRVYCFMTTQVASVTTAAPAGAKMIYLADGVSATGGVNAMSARCEAVKPLVLTGKTVKAMISTTTTPASAVVDPLQTYVRPDGVVVGTGAELLAGNGGLRSGVWQQYTGQYVTGGAVMTGSASPTLVGDAMSTCSNWSPSGISGFIYGDPSNIAEWWLTPAGTPMGCAASYVIHCLEQ